MTITGKKNLNIRLSILLLTGIFGWTTLAAKDCFDINVKDSKVLLHPGQSIGLPNNGKTEMLNCNESVLNFNIKVDFNHNTEPYFEDNPVEMIGILMHKGTTYLMFYDKALNTFMLPNNLPNLGAGNYLLTITASDCTPNGAPCDSCLVTHSFEVQYKQDTQIDVTIDSDPKPPVLTCLAGSNVTLTGIDGPNKNFKMQWSRLVGNEFLPIIGAVNKTLPVNQAGTYQYTLSGPGGCSGSNFITVYPAELPLAIIQPDTQKLNACTQEIKGLKVDNPGPGPANLKYTWSASTGGVIKAGAGSPVPVAGAPGTYAVVVTRADNGCSATASVTILLGNVQIVSVDIAKSPTKAQLDCSTSEVTLSAQAALSSGTSTFSYLWSTGATSPEIKVSQPGTYSVSATDTVGGCQGEATATVVRDTAPPVVNIQSNRDTLCPGEIAVLIALAQEPVEYRWNDSSISNVFATPLTGDGLNTYTVTVTAADNGCTGTASRSLYRVSMPAVTCMDQVISVENRGRLSLDCQAGADELIWVATPKNVKDMPLLGAGPILDQEFALVEERTGGSVLYYFYARNAGCTSPRAEVLVQVLPKNAGGLFVPELITPNGDGANDTWDIVLSDEIQNPEAYTLALFSRNGAKVHEGTLATIFHANDYPDGSYFYVIVKPDGEKITGAVTILRRQ